MTDCDLADGIVASEKATARVNKDGWNQYTIRALGEQISLSLNGETSVNYKEEDPAIASGIAQGELRPFRVSLLRGRDGT